MDEAAEDSLVTRSLGGDKRPFEQLVLVYGKPLFNAAFRILNDREDARDATQTAFVKAYEKLSTYDSRHRFFSWIYRILVNEALNALHGRRRNVPLPADLPADDRSPEEACDARSVRDAVQRAVASLPPQYRVVITLRCFGDLSYREMAYVLDLPERTVKSRLFTARQRLCTALARWGAQT